MNILTQLDFSKQSNRRKVMRELKAQARNFKWDAQALNRATELPLSACYGWLDGTVGAPSMKNAMAIAIKVEEIEAGAIVREDGWLGQEELVLEPPVTEPEPTALEKAERELKAVCRLNNELAYLLEIYRGKVKINEAEILLNGYRQGRFV
jgi:hypothetical protein